MTKILVICLGGQVRSVAMCNDLNRHQGFVAIPTGAANPFPVNFNWLTSWADRIILMVPVHRDRIPDQNRNKVIEFEIGNDVWGRADHPNLIVQIDYWLKRNIDRLT